VNFFILFLQYLRLFVQPAGGRPLGLIDDSTYDHRPSEVLGTFVVIL